MEHTQLSSELFSLSIDPVTKSHLAEAAKWARFLAIVGMVFLALLIIFGFFGAAMFFSTSGSFGGEEFGATGMPAYASTMIAVYMIVIAVIWFFPLLYTIRFANQMRVALAGNDQLALNKSFQNLKICLRYLGIVTIIILAIYAIIIAFTVIGASMFS